MPLCGLLCRLLAPHPTALQPRGGCLGMLAPSALLLALHRAAGGAPGLRPKPLAPPCDCLDAASQRRPPYWASSRRTMPVSRLCAWTSRCSQARQTAAKVGPDERAPAEQFLGSGEESPLDMRTGRLGGSTTPLEVMLGHMAGRQRAGRWPGQQLSLAGSREPAQLAGDCQSAA